MADNENVEPEENKEQGKTYTQEDINKMMASKDKEVRASIEQEYKDKLAQASKMSADERKKIMDEGAKRAQMTADEKAKAELADRQKELESQKAEFEQRMKALDERQALSDTKEALVDAGLSKDFASFLSSTDEETRSNNIKGFTEAFNKAVDEAVDKRVSGKKNPDTGSTTKPSSGYKVPTTKDELFNMPLKEQQEFLNDNPEQARALMR